MYKLIKDSSCNVSVMNTDTSSSIIIGRMCIPILDILDKYRITPPGGIATLWEIEIPEEVKNELLKLTIKYSKSTRKTKEVVKPKQQVDALDVLFGRASY